MSNACFCKLKCFFSMFLRNTVTTESTAMATNPNPKNIQKALAHLYLTLGTTSPRPIVVNEHSANQTPLTKVVSSVNEKKIENKVVQIKRMPKTNLVLKVSTAKPLMSTSKSIAMCRNSAKSNIPSLFLSNVCIT